MKVAKRVYCNGHGIPIRESTFMKKNKTFDYNALTITERLIIKVLRERKEPLAVRVFFTLIGEMVKNNKKYMGRPSWNGIYSALQNLKNMNIVGVRIPTFRMKAKEYYYLKTVRCEK